MGYRRRPGSEGHNEREDRSETTDTLTHAHHPRFISADTIIIYVTMIIIILKQPGAAAHPGFISQKVVPHDRRPASGQLAHIGDDHQW